MPLPQKNETIEHNYPHCWRCRNPLIYKALNAWYFAVEKIKPQLIKNNELINWHPESNHTFKHGVCESRASPLVILLDQSYVIWVT